MPDRERLRDLRRERDENEGRIRRLGADIGAADVALAAAHRRGDTSGVAAARAERDALRRSRAQAGSRVATLAADIDAERDRFDRDFADRISELGADVPVALLPVRIETRFLPHADEPPTRLWVRIYPDDVHIDTHEPELTAREVRDARLYWATVADSDDVSVVEAAWHRLRERHPPNRAEWILRATEPPDDGSPAGEPARKDGPWTRAAMARALPDRFVALGYVNGRRVLTEWGALVPDRIPAGPQPDLDADDTLDRLAGPPAEQREVAIDDGMRWLVDLDEAERLGMAIKVELPPELAGGLDRLVVVGVRWSDAPADAADALESLLDGHRFTEGLAVLRPDAPTNNTATGRSAATSERSQPDPIRRRGQAGPGTVGASIAVALGIDAASIADLEGAARVDHGGELQAALWGATLGYYAEQLLLPLLSDRTVDRLRDHFVDYVRGRGPLPSLRIGDQPYGLLPVVAPGRLRSGEEDISQPLEAFLGRIRGFWTHAARNAPRLGRSGDPVGDLVEVLGMSPVTESLEGRPVVGRQLLENLFRIGGAPLSPIPEPAMEAQRAVAGMLLSAVGVRDRTIRLASMAAVDASYPIRRPFVEAGTLSKTEPPSRDFVSRILADLGHPDTVRRLRSGLPLPQSLLEALLSHAALVALGDVATRLNLTARGRPSRVLMEAEFVDVETADSMTATPLRLVDRPVDGVTGERTVAEAIAEGGEGLQDHLVAYDQFRAGLKGLVGVPSAELHRLFVDLIDVLSHRLDAWYTSLATRRLEGLRTGTPAGVHVGAFGFVEDLRPAPPDATVAGRDGEALAESADNAGYVHAPSLAHASTAAILRSGFLAHGGAAEELLSVDLSSRRVRRAMDLIEGVRAGERLGAVLGYRIERALRERELGRYVLPLRAAAPLVVDVSGSPDIVEAAIAGSVVDGEALVGLAEAGELFGGGSRPFDGDDPNRQAVEAVIAEAADSVDAVADLLLAESVHQTVQGDTASASAALAAVDEGATPPDPAVARTPRTGVGLTHRVLVLLAAAGGPAPGWPAGAALPRTVAEPALDRWAGAMLGRPDRVRVQATFRDDTGAQVGRASFTITDVGIAALDVLCGLQRGSHGEHSELEARLLRHAEAKRPAGAPEDARPQLLAGRDPGVAADEVALDELLLVAEQLARVISGARPASSRDVAAPEDELEVPAGVDVAALRQRADVVEAAFRDAVVRLEAAVELADPGAIETRLMGVAGFGLAGSVPAPGESGDELSIRGRSVQGTAEGLLAALHELTVPENTSEDEATVAALVERIELIHGGQLRVLPAFVAATSAELASSRAQSTQLQDGDPTRAAGWLAHSGLVREGAGRLAQAVLLSETITGGDTTGDLRVVQLPHVAGDRWVALEFPDDRRPVASTAVVLHDPDGADFADQLQGFVIDEWTEVVPRDSEITGLTFHYEQPDATAPNAILIGVHPGDAPTWDLDTLEATVLESIDLARLRAVDSDALRWVGRFLPMLYFPDNIAGDTARVDLLRMARREPG